MSENKISKTTPSRERQRHARAIQKATGMPYAAALRQAEQHHALVDAIQVLGRYGSKTHNAIGTRPIDPHCDGPCGRVIRVDDGEKWNLVRDPSKTT